MAKRISISIWMDDEPAASPVQQRLEEAGFRIQSRTAEAEVVESALRRGAASAVYVALGDEAEKRLSWVETLPEPRPAVLVGGAATSDTMLRAMRAGAVAFFPDHQIDDSLDVCARKLAAAAQEEAGRGQLVAVLGCKGGAGATTVACELSARLAAQRKRVALVDAKPYFGDVALHMDLEVSHTLGDPVARGQELDDSFSEYVVTPHAASGVSVVAAPVDPDEADGIDGAHIDRVGGFLRETHDVVVMDLPRLTDDISLAALDQAEQVVLVTTQTLSGIARARQHRRFLGELGIGDDRLRLVLNQTTERDPFGIDASEAFGIAPVAAIPLHPAIAAAPTEGRPLLSGKAPAELRSAFDALTGALGAEQNAEPAPLAGNRFQQLVEEIRCRFATA